jgi:hypothetical protein
MGYWHNSPDIQPTPWQMVYNNEGSKILPRQLLGKNLNLTQTKCDQDSHIFEFEVVTITLVLYTYFSLFKPISMTG